MPQKRIVYLDLARGLAVFFMILQHAVIIFDTDMGEKSVLGMIMLALGTAPAAPVFLTLMGIFFSRKREITLNREILYGLKLVGLGYLLNLFRFFLPLSLEYLENPVAIFTLQKESPFDMLLSIDILQTAGYSWMVLALLKRYLPHKEGLYYILAGLLAILSPLFWCKTSVLTPLAAFWGTAHNVFFPLFPWVIYPILGLAIGPSLLNPDKEQLTLKLSALLGIITVLEGVALLFFLGDTTLFSLGDYHRSGIAVQMILMGFVGIWMWLCKQLASRSLIKKIMPLLSFWSREVTKIYFIQWILFSWLTIFISENSHDSFIALLIALIMTVVTHILSLVITQFYSPK